MHAGQLTLGERLRMFVKAGGGPNLIAAHTYHPSARDTLLRLCYVGIDNVNRPPTTSLAMVRDQGS